MLHGADQTIERIGRAVDGLQQFANLVLAVHGGTLCQVALGQRFGDFQTLVQRHDHSAAQHPVNGTCQRDNTQQAEHDEDQLQLFACFQNF